MDARHLVSFALAAATTGCFLLIDDVQGGLGNACHVAGETSACGSCIVKSCGAELNACCGDAACQKVLDQVDACSVSGKCGLDLTDTGAQGKLALCLSSACGAACKVSSTNYLSDCSTGSYNGIGTNECSCQGQGKATPVECDATTFANALCCADAYYPQMGKSCSCVEVGCAGVSDGCACAPSDSVYYPGDALKSCDGVAHNVCCASSIDRACRCYDNRSACDQYSEVEVASCGIGSFGCTSNRSIVSNCSYAVK